MPQKRTIVCIEIDGQFFDPNPEELAKMFAKRLPALPTGARVRVSVNVENQVSEYREVSS